MIACFNLILRAQAYAANTITGIPPAILIRNGSNQWLFLGFSSHKDEDRREQASVGLISYFFTVYGQYFVEHCLEILPPGLFPIHELIFGGKVFHVEVDIFEIHPDDFVEGLELAVPLRTPDHQFRPDKALNYIFLYYIKNTL